MNFQEEKNSKKCLGKNKQKICYRENICRIKKFQTFFSLFVLRIFSGPCKEFPMTFSVLSQDFFLKFLWSFSDAWSSSQRLAVCLLVCRFEKSEIYKSARVKINNRTGNIDSLNRHGIWHKFYTDMIFKNLFTQKTRKL